MRPRRNSTINSTQLTAIWTINFDNSVSFANEKQKQHIIPKRKANLYRREKGNFAKEAWEEEELMITKFKLTWEHSPSPVDKEI